MKKTIKQLQTEIKKARKKVDDWEKKRDSLYKELYSKCKHPVESIVEAPYYSGSYVTIPPFRVCTICGLSEEGWGCGYNLLAPEVYSDLTPISRDKGNEITTKWIPQKR